jgi:predicted methyltransferase
MRIDMESSMTRFRVAKSLLLLLSSLSVFADVISDAVNNTQRSESDRKSDASRYPEAVLRFAGLKPGDEVLDFLAGAGFYAEIMSSVVGEKGRVDVYNNRPYLDWIGAQLTARYTAGKMNHTRRLEMEVDDLDLGEKQYDVILAAMALHDLYYADPANGWPIIDKDALYQKLLRSLKPNGVLIVIDHAAEEKTELRDVQKLHRIDEAYLIKDLQQAGFKLAGREDALRNPKDERRSSSFDEKIRSHTDRFMLKFVRNDSKARSAKGY